MMGDHIISPLGTYTLLHSSLVEIYKAILSWFEILAKSVVVLLFLETDELFFDRGGLSGLSSTPSVHHFIV